MNIDIPIIFEDNHLLVVEKPQMFYHREIRQGFGYVDLIKEI